MGFGPLWDLARIILRHIHGILICRVFVNSATLVDQIVSRTVSWRVELGKALLVWMNKHVICQKFIIYIAKHDLLLSTKPFCARRSTYHLSWLQPLNLQHVGMLPIIFIGWGKSLNPLKEKDWNCRCKSYHKVAPF